MMKKLNLKLINLIHKKKINKNINKIQIEI